MSQPTQISGVSRPQSKPWLLLAVFSGVAVITICNLNAIGANIFDISQLFSPLILLFCVVGWFASKGSLHKISGTPIWPFFLALSFFLMLGLASGMGQRDLKLMPAAISLIASLVILVSISSVTLALVSKGQSATVLIICYFTSMLATLSVFIPIVYPEWHNLMQSKDDQRASGFFSNPNEAGVAIMYFLVFAFALASYKKQPLWVMTAIPLSVASVFYTFSRSSFLGVFLLIILLSFFFFQIKRVVLSSGVIILGLSLLFFMRSYIDEASRNERDFSSRQIQRLQLFNDLLSGRIDSETTGGRDQLAAWTISEWQKSPFVGHGLSSFSGGKNRLGSHNTYLMVLGEVGLIGFIPFVVAWVMLLRTIIRQRERWLIVLGLGTFLAISIAGMASHNMFERRDGIFVMTASFGIIAGLSRLRRRRVFVPSNLSNAPAINQKGSLSKLT